jgi:hypothetical protein
MTWSSLPHQRAAADRDGLLTDVEVQKAADLLRLVGAEAALFEAPDAHHLAVQLNLFIARQPGVDGRHGMIGAGFGGRG